MAKQQTAIKESPLFWPARMTRSGVLKVLDETRIPRRITYLEVVSSERAVEVIASMKTRAFGQFLVVLNAFLLDLADKEADEADLVRRLHKTAEALNSSRSTFPFAEVTSIVLQWVRSAMEQEEPLRPFVRRRIEGYLNDIRQRRLKRVEILASIIKDGDILLTHCNVSGELAMAAALARRKNRVSHVFATETRPYFQGARLTCWELRRMGIDVTLVPDNAAGTLIADGLINKVIVGSDRCCANGDFANKIGTYQIAVVAKEFDVPVYVLTQPSAGIKRGEDIPVEVRSPEEVLMFNGQRVMPEGVMAFYPGFDVVPQRFMTQAIPIDPR